MLGDDCGFSSTMDAIIFLSLVSVASLIISPVLIGNLQAISLIDKKGQLDSSSILLTILNCKVDNFGYRFAGTQMDAITGMERSDLYRKTTTMIAGRENKHKTFADLTAECLAAQFYIYGNSSRLRLNIFTEEYDREIKGLLAGYLDRQLGDRYSYCFEAKWRPFIGIPAGGEIKAGERPPASAFVEKAMITMPYENVITREWAEAEINEELRKIDGDVADYDAERINKTVFKERVKQRLCNATEKIVEKIADRAVEELFRQTLKQNLGLSQFDELRGVESNPVFLGDELISNYNSSVDSNEVAKAIAASAGGDANEQLKSYLKTRIKADLDPLIKEQVKKLLDRVIDRAADKTVSAVDRALALKEHFLDELFARLNLSRAEVSLAIWDRRN